MAAPLASWKEKFSVDYLRENLAFDPYTLVYGLYSAPTYHLIVEGLLLVWILKLLFFTKSFKPQKGDLTEKEKDALIEEWEPEPLVPESKQEYPQGFTKLVSGVPGRHITINGQSYLNLSSMNFLDFLGNEEIEKTALSTVKHYGVGSCGPRGFYGTVDVHLTLEKQLAEFMRVEEAILYSYGFATIASAIPAYSKRGDVIFADEGVSFPIQKGLDASRSLVKYFKHNDMGDLERRLEEQAEDDRKNPKKAKATRRFLVVEGLYMNYGDLCPLPKLIEYKYKYKVRIFMDESYSFGTLGSHGRGVTEYFDCNIDDVDMICASLEYSVGSIGGFSCGRSFVVDHQRLSGLGYCFSASLPPLLASGASTALDMMSRDPDMFEKLKNKSRTLHNMLKKFTDLKNISDAISPMKHLVLTYSDGDLEADSLVIDKLVEYCMNQGVAVTQARYIRKFERQQFSPSLRLCVNVNMSDADLQKAVNSIASACHKHI